MIKKLSSLILATVLFAFVVNGQTTNDEQGKSPTAAKPISYGLVIDNSGSQRPILENVIESAQAIVETNSPDDETFIVRFVGEDNIKIIQDFTSSVDELDDTLNGLFIEGGMTAILDAVYFSAQHLAEKENSAGGQKILILITDGEDRHSATKIGNLIKFLKEKKIKVYTLGLSDGKIYKGLLEKLAKETGGKSFMVEKRPELKNIVKELTTAVRAQ